MARNVSPLSRWRWAFLGEYKAFVNLTMAWDISVRAAAEHVGAICGDRSEKDDLLRRPPSHLPHPVLF